MADPPTAAVSKTVLFETFLAEKEFISKAKLTFINNWTSEKRQPHAHLCLKKLVRLKVKTIKQQNSSEASKKFLNFAYFFANFGSDFRFSTFLVLFHTKKMAATFSLRLLDRSVGFGL